MARRIVVLFVAVALVAVGTASGAPERRSAFASSEIRTVVKARLMGPSVAAFRPDDPLTSSELGLDGGEQLGTDEGDGAVVPLHVKTVSGDVSLVRASAALAS
jgi:hypothetical protein